MPRRRVLKTIVNDLQDLADRKIDFLAVSLPPRVGKSTLCIFFMTWLMGKNPDIANVMSGHSDKLTEGFYREILSIITNTEDYNWHLVFPDVSINETSAKNETIDLNKHHRFPTLTCRSISGTLTGAVEVGEEGVLYCDDLVEDLQESLNPRRLEAKYDAYLNQLKDRKKDGARELMVGTRWNILDPIGRNYVQYKDNPRYRFSVIPALNEERESNFVYDYGLGFSTEYYLDMKASIDNNTWMAKYQGKPYARDGLLFENLRYYNGVLPNKEPDRILGVCDVAWGGGDSLSAPIGYVYGEDCYIHDWVFSKKDKKVTIPQVAETIKRNKVQTFRVEANNGGDMYAESLDKALKEMNYRTNITSVRSLSNKFARILQYAPEIRTFYFRDVKSRGAEYNNAMEELCSISASGVNPHDDAPDSLGMLAEELYTGFKMVQTMKAFF